MLYALAMKFGKKALAVSTVSDHLSGEGSVMSPKEREQGFSEMVHNVLESVQ